MKIEVKGVRLYWPRWYPLAAYRYVLEDRMGRKGFILPLITYGDYGLSLIRQKKGA